MRFDVYTYSNRGGRPYNEDSVGFRTEGDNGIFVVADGLGGHSYGEVASACVRDILLEELPGPETDRNLWFGERIAQANQQVLALQQEKGTVLKSTVVALSILGDRAAWAHAGDSRLYYIHAGRLTAYTEDHSVAYKKYKAGEITRRQIAFDEDQPRLLRRVGGQDHNEPVVRVLEEPLWAGDAFFLCSDGVWEFLEEEEIVIDLLKSENARQWAEYLLLRMMERVNGENDNLTMLTLMLG